ncbi:MAG: sigma-70 family RNA polymerase sigma factor [Saprospirales bacterium]|nr:sigma-70 family RNA polymerase sigma factor [Saprospirales bacterium]MBK8491449.1 sigma-70 family RNA polymerase sigma factor [Saprospirales bacterium]
MQTTMLGRQESLREMPLSHLVLTYQQNHHPLLLSELYTRYFDRVYNYCFSLSKNQDLALDLTQDVFLKITEHLDELRNPDLFPAWLFRIAHNRFINHVKSTSRTNQIPAFATESFDDPEAHETAMEREVMFQKVLTVLDEIPETDRELLIDKYFHKVSIHHLETKYGLSESAIKMRLSRARQRIAKKCG